MSLRLFPILVILLFAIPGIGQNDAKSVEGIKLFDRGDFVGAVNALKNSDNFIDLNYLGYAYEKLGKGKEARSAFEPVVQERVQRIRARHRNSWRIRQGISGPR